MTAPAPAGELSPAGTRLLVGLFVALIGLVILVPNTLPVLTYWQASRQEAVNARWAGSETATSTRDTVGIPIFVFERRIGPMVQECRVPLVQYRHAPGGKPLHEVLQVVPGTRCEDLVVLNDPPRERLPLILLGLAVLAGGLWLTVLARRRPA